MRETGWNSSVLGWNSLGKKGWGRHMCTIASLPCMPFLLSTSTNQPTCMLHTGHQVLLWLECCICTCTCVVSSLPHFRG